MNEKEAGWTQREKNRGNFVAGTIATIRELGQALGVTVTTIRVTADPEHTSGLETIEIVLKSKPVPEIPPCGKSESTGEVGPSSSG